MIRGSLRWAFTTIRGSSRWALTTIRGSLRWALTKLAIPELVLAVGLLAPLIAALSLAGLWITSPPAARSGVVAEATLAVTILGFTVAFLALVSAAEQVRRAVTPPRVVATFRVGELVVRVQLPPQIPDDYLASAPPISLANEGPGAAQVTRVVVRHSIVMLTDSSAAYMAMHGFRMTPLIREDDPWDMKWEQVAEGQWAIREQFTLRERDQITLQPFELETIDADAVSALLAARKFRICWRTAITIHTDRTSDRHALDLPLEAVDVWSDDETSQALAERI